MFRLHTRCRACRSEELIDVLDLGLMPLANDFVGPTDKRSGYAPLKLQWCPQCTLGQLSVVVDPSILYRNYAYITSHSDMMMDHFGKLASDLALECGRGFVVEIGSNDGTLLGFLEKKGFSRVLGVDPAQNLCDIALGKGINTLNQFFNSETANDIVTTSGHPDLVIARHVFCHIDDWDETIHALGTLCSKDTVVAIEVPYLCDTLVNVEWDQIYHEHTSYLTVKAMRAALEGSMLHLHAMKHYTIHGGAIVLLLRRNDCDIKPEPNIENGENVTLHDMKFFAHQTKQQIECFKKTVSHLVNDGKRVVGYGASAKCAQWIQACGFDKGQIQWVCDNTPFKQFKTMPGTNIQVVEPSTLAAELPDYAVCFAWNFADEIIRKEKTFREKGGRWIIPHGDIRIV